MDRKEKKKLISVRKGEWLVLASEFQCVGEGAPALPPVGEEALAWPPDADPRRGQGSHRRYPLIWGDEREERERGREKEEMT